MNRELRRAILLRKQLWSKYKRSGYSTDHLNYKQQRNLTVKLRRKAIASHLRNVTKDAKGSKSTHDIVQTGEWQRELKTDLNWHGYLMTILSTSTLILILIVVIVVI